VATPQFNSALPVIPVRALRKAVIDWGVSYGSLMAGQSVGLVKDIKPVREIVADIKNEMEEELVRVMGFLLDGE
jgi:enoyl-[acyl-carrier protein] reductase II